MTMFIVVSGVAGLIGSWVARRALARGWRVAGIDDLSRGYPDNIPEGVEFARLDCRDTVSCKPLMRGADAVVHCASLAHEGFSLFAPTLVCTSVIGLSSSMATAAANAGVRRFIQCSSMARYGAQAPPFHEGLQPSPVDPYGAAKVCAESVVRTLGNAVGMEVVVVVPHNVFGVGQRYDDPYRNVVGIMLNRLFRGLPPWIYGDGSQTRALTPALDAAEAILATVVAPCAAGEVFNIGTGPEYALTMRDLALALGETIGSTLAPVYVGARPVEVQHATCDVQKIKHMLGVCARPNLYAAFAEMAEWIRRRGPARPLLDLPIELTALDVPPPWDPSSGFSEPAPSVLPVFRTPSGNRAIRARGPHEAAS